MKETAAASGAARPTAFPGADRVPLVGGRLCLDFVNTTGARRSAAPRERLRTPRDFLVWSRRAGILGEAERRLLEARARRQAAAATRDLAGILALRESLYRLFLAARAGRAPRRPDLCRLERWWLASARHRRLVPGRAGLAWTWRHEGGLGSACGPIVLSATELLTARPATPVKQCGACDWLFVDPTRNRSRRWCKKLCRDRVKARRYYRRTRRRRA